MVRALVLVCVCCAACGAPAAEAGVEARPEATGPCGGFEERALGEEVGLLGGRLHLRPLAGAGPPTRSLSTSGVAQAWSGRLVVEDGDATFALVAVDVFHRRTHRTLLEDAREVLGPRAAELRSSTLPSGLEVVTALPAPGARAGEAIVVATSFVALPDGSLVTIAFLVDERHHGAGCAQLAERVAASLRAGEASLELRAGERELVGGLSITVPDHHVVLPTLEDERRIQLLSPVGTPAGLMDVALRGPLFAPTPEPEERSVPGELFGAPVTWWVSTGYGGTVLARTFAPVPPPAGAEAAEASVELTIVASTEPVMRAFMAVARTLRRAE